MHWTQSIIQVTASLIYLSTHSSQKSMPDDGTVSFNMTLTSSLVWKISVCRMPIRKPAKTYPGNTKIMYKEAKINFKKYRRYFVCNTKKCLRNSKSIFEKPTTNLRTISSFTDRTMVLPTCHVDMVKWGIGNCSQDVWVKIVIKGTLQKHLYFRWPYCIHNSTV